MGMAPDRWTPDLTLAVHVTAALRQLAAHSPSYAAVFAQRPGVRVAGDLSAGLVTVATDQGRDAMLSVLSRIEAAMEVEPGLDTNSFLDIVSGRGAAQLRRAS